ncbi:MAG: DUF2806 domain-containing protein [Porphyrobacter sp. IPPAS B-1204]|nr:MAG: DUF2806 domain-containing protein [Porphyrobacter sp. IPPAS B-1204]
MGESDNGPRELTTIESVLANGLSHLPEFLSQTAFGAISRLVTGLVDIPAIALAGYKERLEDRNKETRTLRQALSNAAIAKIVEDDAIVQRTVDRLINEEVNKQRSREAVASGTLTILAERSQQTSDQKVDEDWLDSFINKAETARSDEMRALWSRVLAGEIATPGSFSKRSLEVLKTLDRQEAEKFSKIVQLSFGNIIPTESIGKSGDNFSDARVLEDLGLLSGVLGTLAKPLMHTPGKLFGGLAGRRFHLQVHSTAEVSVKAVFLTQVGRELAYLVEDPDGMHELAVARSIGYSLVGQATSAMILRKNEHRQLSDPELLFGTMEYRADSDSFVVRTNLDASE